MTPTEDTLVERPAPVGYRYRYHHGLGPVWRFGTSGREINGSRPVEAEAVYSAADVDALLTRIQSDAETIRRLEGELAEARRPKRDAMLTRSEAEWDALEDATVTVYGLREGMTLTAADVAALNLVEHCRHDDEEAATDAYHRGYETGLRERGGDELVNLTRRYDEAVIAKSTERMMRALAEARATAAEKERADDLALTGCRDAEDLRDMANVGQSLMDALNAMHRGGGKYADWAPADDPAEIVVDLLNDLDETADRLAAAEARADELQRTFELQWAADQRAIKRWQAAAPGRDLTWPDRSDMVVWLLELLEGSKKLSSEQVRSFALLHDHLAIPIRPGVTLTWTDEESGEVLSRASLKGRNVVPLRAAQTGENASDGGEG